MKKILLILSFFASSLQAQDKVIFIATGVTCSMCSNAIHKSLKQDKNIIKIEPNLETQQWLLEYKSGQFRPEDLVKMVKDAGFSVSKIYLNDNLILDNSKKKKKKN
jgi:copper chaperone CopZ